MEPSADLLRYVCPDPGGADKHAPHPWWHLWRWIPIRALRPRHRQRIEQHLLGLSNHDRYLRFGYPASDERIRAYVASLNFTRDEVFGIFNRRLELVAMTHLAYPDSTAASAEALVAEFAVSVRAQVRGRGYGARLFDHAVMHARNRRVVRLLIHAMSENTPMLNIARQAGATVQRDGGESEAWLSLPPDTVGSQVKELISTHAAEFNYGVQFRKRQLGRVLPLAHAVRRRLAPTEKVTPM